MTPDLIEVFAVSDTELQRSTDRALADIGLTYDELAAEGATGDWCSEKARRLWSMIAPLEAAG